MRLTPDLSVRPLVFMHRCLLGGRGCVTRGPQVGRGKGGGDYS